MQIEVLQGQLTEEQQSRCRLFIKNKYPGQSIEKLLLYADETGIRFEVIVAETPRLRKMSGYYISDPRTWNAAKQAELRDTLPNLLDI